MGKQWEQQAKGKKQEGNRDVCWESKRKKQRHAVQMATQLIATVTHKQNDICLRKCRQTKTRAQYTTTSHQAMLISTHPGFLSLALIHSLLKRQRWTHARKRTHMHTSLSFIPKYMKANLSHPLPAIISLQLSEALFPLHSQHGLLNLSVFSGKQFSPHCTARILDFLWPPLSLVLHHPCDIKSSTATETSPGGTLVFLKKKWIR